jgi:haloalkane dehalogenase
MGVGEGGHVPERFQYPFKENYHEVDGIRLHYVDEGSGPPILMVHGQPTWSYLYRKMIPPLVAAGYRCVAPDLMGFGLSDKPQNESAYTLRRHVELVTGLIEKLDLQSVIAVGQDWGGPISLRYAIDHRDNVRALVILNTLVRTPPSMPLIFKLIFRSGGFSSFLMRRLDLFRKMAFRGGLMFKRPVDTQAMEQYKMPHPTASTRAGIAAFPKMIPDNTNHPNAEYISEINRTLQEWDIPVLVMFSDKDIAFKVEEGQRIANMVPNGRFQVVRDAGHYLQEDAGEEIAERMVTFLRDEAKVTSS